MTDHVERLRAIAKEISDEGHAGWPNELNWIADALASERAKPNEWKEAVIDNLIVSCIYQNKHEEDPESAINDLLAWETEIALDPQVSSQAQALIDRGAASERAKQADLDEAKEMLLRAKALTFTSLDGLHRAMDEAKRA